MPTVSMTVNGKPATGNVEGRTLLVQFLRDQLGLTGTHIGCDTSQCGACVVHVEGKSVKSCTLLAVQANAQDVALDISNVLNDNQVQVLVQALNTNPTASQNAQQLTTQLLARRVPAAESTPRSRCDQDP